MFDQMKLSRRVWATVVVFAVILGVVMVNAFTGLKNARDSLQSIHEDRMATAVAVGKMRRGYLVNRMEILLMFQHAPESVLAGIHDHPIGMHMDNLSKLKAENDEAQKAAFAREVNAEEKALFDDLTAKRTAWQTKRDQVLESVKKGNFSPAIMNMFLVAGRTEGAAFEQARQRSHNIR